MRHLLPLIAMLIVCSDDKGLTRTVFDNVHNVFYAEQCLVFEADRVQGQMAVCDPKAECVIYQGTVYAPGTPSQDYQKQESTGTVKQ